MDKFLAIFEKFGPLNVTIPIPKLIKSNKKKTCLDCGTKITWLNDSGWEGFAQDGVTTQPICKACDKARYSITTKDDS